MTHYGVQVRIFLDSVGDTILEGVNRGYTLRVSEDGSSSVFLKDTNENLSDPIGIMGISSLENFAAHGAELSLLVGPVGDRLRGMVECQDCLRIEINTGSGWHCAFDGFVSSISWSKTSSPHGFSWRLSLHAEGILPAAFESACRAGVRLAVFSPTLHNPTTSTMGLARRLALVALARRWDVTIVEEDVYGLLREDAPPALAALAPERVLYLTGLSKTVAPGLRLGYLAFPRGLAGRMRDAEHHTSWYVSPLATAVATRWMDDGTAWRRLLAQRKEPAARHRLCRDLLGAFTWRGEPHCPHLWLVSPPGGSAAFSQRASAVGVVVVPAEVFATGRQAGDGVRLSLGAATDRAALADGLGRLATLAGR